MTLACFGRATDAHGLIIPNSFVILYQMTPFTEKHKGALRHRAKLHYRCVFSDSPSMKWGSDGCFRLFTGDADCWRLTQGSPILFYQSPWRQPVALGKQICDPEEKALQGEACLINRIVPVWFTLLNWSHPGRSSQNGSALNVMRLERPSCLSLRRCLSL